MNSNSGKTYILDDQWTDKDALDFTPYVETLADIIQKYTINNWCVRHMGLR